MDIKIDISSAKNSYPDFPIYDSTSEQQFTNYGLLDKEELVKLLGVLIDMKCRIEKTIIGRMER